MGTAAPKYAGRLGAVELNATFHDRGNATYDSQAFKGRCPCVPGVPRVVLNAFYALALTPYGCTEIATSSFMEVNTGQGSAVESILLRPLFCFFGIRLPKSRAVAQPYTA